MSRANMLVCSFGECRDSPESISQGLRKMGEEEEDVYLSR